MVDTSPLYFNMTFENDETFKIIVILTQEFIDIYVISPFNSVNVINICIETPTRFNPDFNIIRQAALQQYFGRTKLNTYEFPNVCQRSTYGFFKGSACKTVGGDYQNLVTRVFNLILDNIINMLLHLIINYQTFNEKLNATHCGRK